MTERFDVVYGTHDGRDVHLDIYQPTGSTNHGTAILLFHGGGFRQGDRKMLQPQSAALAACGFTAMAVEYRLIDDTEVIWPAPLHDVKAAIAWTTAHAGELGIDQDKIVLQGHSAGALLSLVAAGTVGHPEFRPAFDLEASERPVAAVLAYYPPAQLVLRDMPALPTDGPPTAELLAELTRAMRGDDGSIPAAILFGPTATEEKAAAASPLTHLKGGFPPTLFFHGTADMVVAPTASSRLFNALEAADVVTELHLIAGAHHAFESTPSLNRSCVAATNSFLCRYLIDPAGFADEEATTNPLAAIARAQG